MITEKELYEDRLTRLKKAVNLDKPDRVPVMAWIDSFAAVYKGVKMSKFSSQLLPSNKAMLRTFRDFPEFDAAEVSATPPRDVAAATLSKVKLAGKELPEGSLWQVDEQERIKEEDYDKILKIGYKKFLAEYRKKKLNISTFYTVKMIASSIIADGRFKKAGIPLYSSTFVNIPLDPLAGGRSMAKFMRDLFRMPDKVQAVMDVMMPDIISAMKMQVKNTKTFSVFLGVARASSEFISPKLWDRFVWPYVKQVVNAIIETGSFANLHFDGNWDRDIDRFKELPKGKCVWASDSGTDIFKLKKALDGHMCLKGAVSPALLTVGTPDEVYKYSAKLIKEIGPTGFILAPGCTLPMNAKVENVKAMLSAVSGK